MSLIRFLTFANLALAATNTISIPLSPTQGSTKLNAAPISFSLEFFEFPTYITNFKNTLPCISGLKELTGVWPNIRLGGSTQDRAAYDPALTTYVNYSLPENASMGFPDVLTYGPSYLKLAGSYPGKVVLGLNRGSNNITNTIEGAVAAQKYMNNLYSIELGNEPVIFAYTGAAIAPDPKTWTAQADATSQQEWQIAIGTALENTSIIQAGVFYQPPPEYGAQELLANEDPSAIPYIRTFSHHNYPQDPVSNIANLTKLMSHINIVKNVEEYATDVQASRNAGFEYVFGESNSVSGGGNISVSPTFGAALWVADYSLQAASANISHIYFHQAAINACYYLWWHNNTVTSPYYGGYFATAAMAGTSYIQPLDDRTTNYAAYALYTKNKKLKRVVLINSDYYDGVGEREIQTFVLTGLGASTSVIRVRRLTADSALAKQDDGDNPRFGGQSFSNSTCRLDGEEASEVIMVSDGSVHVSVASSEAVLLEF